MSTYLIACTPLHGHVVPLLAVGRHLAKSGHEVTFVTGTRYRDMISDAGLDFAPLIGQADYDEHDLATYLPDAHRHRGIRLSQYQVQQTFIRPIPDQWRSVEKVLDTVTADVVIVDCMFAGALPLLLRPPGTRPPVIALGISPLPQVSRNTAPYNMALRPSWSWFGRARNRVLNTIASKILFAPTQRLAERLVADAAGHDLPHDFPFVLDLVRVFDRYLQLGPAELEYALADLAPQVRFVGPVSSTDAPAACVPSWWDDLDDGRPVVLVTQGTLDNADVNRLLRPSIMGLAGLDAHVVVTTGGSAVEALGALPDNVRAAEFLPYDLLMPRVDVLVTNGGFGTVLHALSHGVPLVVAPGAEDKPEVAARAAYFEVGINLRTSSPEPRAVADAVRHVLETSHLRSNARLLGQAMEKYQPLDAIDAELASVQSASPR